MPHCLFSAAFTKSDIAGKVRWVRLKFDFGLLVCLSCCTSQPRTRGRDLPFGCSCLRALYLSEREAGYAGYKAEM